MAGRKKDYAGMLFLENLLGNLCDPALSCHKILLLLVISYSFDPGKKLKKMCIEQCHQKNQGKSIISVPTLWSKFQFRPKKCQFYLTSFQLVSTLSLSLRQSKLLTTNANIAISIANINTNLFNQAHTRQIYT